MVTHVDGENSVEMSEGKASYFDGNNYFIAKTPIREPKIHREKHFRANSTEPDPVAPKIMKHNPKKVVCVLQNVPSATPAFYPDDFQQQPPARNKRTEISAADLDDLKSVYKKCKAVMKKIETKYGHLLNLENEMDTNDTPHFTIQTEKKEECHCSANKKILFDENGQQKVQETILNNHICPKKVKRKYSDLFKTEPQINNIQVEYEAPKPLPDDLQVLTNLLQDTNIEITYRNKVISKIREIKQERTNEIRYHRPSLKEQLKGNPDEVLDFKGANLFSLPGYPDGK